MTTDHRAWNEEQRIKKIVDSGQVGPHIGVQFVQIRRIVKEIQELPEGANNQGADKIRELQAYVAEVNAVMSDVGVTVHLMPVALQSSALVILTGLMQEFFLRFVSCEECPYYERCMAMVMMEYNDKVCAERLFEWFSKGDFPWLYENGHAKPNPVGSGD